MSLRGRKNLPAGSSISSWAGAPTTLADTASPSRIYAVNARSLAERADSCALSSTVLVSLDVGLHTRSGEHHRGAPPTGSIRTILAAISMLSSACVGGRALPLDAAPEATWGTSGGCIGSIGGSRDSAWNRRDASGVRP
jgi:hypothetical protein